MTRQQQILPCHRSTLRNCYDDAVKLASRILLLLVLLALLSGIAVLINRLLIPSHNTSATHFDAIIVLGYPANFDGSPSPEQRERVLEGVREYKAGVASTLIMTGGPAHNQFVEAHVMATLAVSQGVPASAIIEEGQAQNTIQNIYYSSQIMHTHHWQSAEVVSSPAHIPRAAMILRAFTRYQPTLAFDWHTHASQWPAEYPLTHSLFLDAFEATRCLQIRIFGLPHSRFLP